MSYLKNKSDSYSIFVLIVYLFVVFFYQALLLIRNLFLLPHLSLDLLSKTATRYFFIFNAALASSSILSVRIPISLPTNVLLLLRCSVEFKEANNFNFYIIIPILFMLHEKGTFFHKNPDLIWIIIFKQEQKFLLN